MQAVRILCVDDDPGILQTLPMVLKVHGYDVATAGSIPEALNIITSEQRFDVLISDLNMGHIADGFTVVHTMRRVNPQCVNLILTGYPAFESALQALRLQVDDYLTKPSDIPSMLETIRRKLSERTKAPIARPMLRLSAILRNNVDAILSRALLNMKAAPDLAALPLTDEERLDTVGTMIRELADHIDSEMPNESNEAMLRSARLRGEARYRQHYSLKLMVERKRILSQVINDVIYENLLSANLSFLMLDMNKLNDAVLLQLEESIEAYQQSEREKA